MDNVISLIPAAQEVPRVSVSDRSVSALSVTEPGRSSSSIGTQAPQSRPSCQSPQVVDRAKHSTPSQSPDLTLQPTEEPVENMDLVLPAPRNLPFD